MPIYRGHALDQRIALQVPPDLANEESDVRAMEGVETEDDIAVATGGDRDYLPVASTFTGGGQMYHSHL
jgi:hypothetical protein